MREELEIYQSLDLDLSQPAVISIVGGGGKTSTMYLLAKELKSLGKKVLVTTTTAIMMPESQDYDIFLTLEKSGHIEEAKLESAKSGTITVLVSEFIREDKLKGIEEEVVDYIFNEGYFDYIIVEADGSKRKPIKAPRKGEPLIPSSTSMVIGLIGLDAFGKPISEEIVHRVEIFKEITGSKLGDIIDEDIIVKLVLHQNGLFKNSEGMLRYLMLNKADNQSLKNTAKSISEELSKLDWLDGIFIAKLKSGEIWK